MTAESAHDPSDASPHRASIGARSLLPKASKHFSEVIGVRETALPSDVLEWQTRRHEKARCFLHSELGDEARRSEAGALAEVMTERAAAHAALRSEDGDANGAALFFEDAGSNRFEQPITLLVPNVLRQPFECERELEQFLLDLEAIAKILVKSAAHETHQV